MLVHIVREHPDMRVPDQHLAQRAQLVLTPLQHRVFRRVQLDHDRLEVRLPIGRAGLHLSLDRLVHHPLVRRVLVDDGTPVEFGTPLMIVE